MFELPSADCRVAGGERHSLLRVLTGTVCPHFTTQLENSGRNKAAYRYLSIIELIFNCVRYFVS
jgi:hypothetical protein